MEDWLKRFYIVFYILFLLCCPTQSNQYNTFEKSENGFRIIAGTYVNQTNKTEKFDILLLCAESNLTFALFHEQHFVKCTLTYNSSIFLSLTMKMDDQNTVKILQSDQMLLAPGSVRHIEILFTVQAQVIGSTNLKVWIEKLDANKIEISNHTIIHTNGTIQRGTCLLSMNVTITVLRHRGICDILFRALIIPLIIIITFVMGCELNLVHIRGYIKDPIGPIIGFVCQFGLMPVVALGLAMFLPIRWEFGFGLLVTGCSPGGSASNIWTYLLHGDLDLSMTMTAISTLLALGMMPLMIFSFGRFIWPTGHIHLPYGRVTAHLLYLFVPMLLGILLNWKRPKVAALFTRATRPLSLCLLVVILGLGTYTNLDVYQVLAHNLSLIPACLCLPALGFLVAALMALLFRRTPKEVLTIGLETGIQNVSIAILVLMHSMPQPQGDIGCLIPIVVASITPIALSLLLVVLSVRRRFCTASGHDSLIETEHHLAGQTGDSAVLTLQRDQHNSIDTPLST